MFEISRHPDGLARDAQIAYACCRTALWIRACECYEWACISCARRCSRVHDECTEGMLYRAGWLGKKVWRGVFDYPKPTG